MMFKTHKLFLDDFKHEKTILIREIGSFMNKQILCEKLWPNNGKIMLELSDYDLRLDERYDQCSLIENFVIVDTVHEDNLKWEDEYVSATLILLNLQQEFNQMIEKLSNNLHAVETLVFSLGNTDRIALADGFDLVSTKEGDYLEFEQYTYSSIRLSIFSNEEKTKVIFVGLLLK